jgi:tRNA threonylcarbamoyladenosine biosynthesis protein TsaB
MKSGLKVPMLDARRMEVYSCVLDENNAVIEPTSAIVVENETFPKLIGGREVVFFGPGMEKCKEVLSQVEKASFHDNILPSAGHMVMISEEKFNKEELENVAYFEPFYLKDFIAGKPKKLL